MSNLKKVSILLCGVSLGLGGMAFATECEIDVDGSITQAECQTMTPSKSAKGHCETGGHKAPVCVWSEWYDKAGKKVVGCWAKCGG